MLQKTIVFKSFYPPSLITLDGQTFVCPGWHKVPSDTTLEEVYDRWTKVMPKSTESEQPRGYTITKMVKSSKGDKEYKVSYGATGWNCECPGYGFRRTCRHIKELQKEKV